MASLAIRKNLSRVVSLQGLLDTPEHGLHGSVLCQEGMDVTADEILRRLPDENLHAIAAYVGLSSGSEGEREELINRLVGEIEILIEQENRRAGWL